MSKDHFDLQRLGTREPRKMEINNDDKCVV
jgi:hypothetical protein